MVNKSINKDLQKEETKTDKTEKKGKLQRVPSLDLDKVNKMVSRNNLTRNKSVDSIQSDEISKLLRSYRETYDDIEDIKHKLAIIESCVKYEDFELRKEIKEIRNHVDSLISESQRTPRMISRCDAIVGNTQGILSAIKQLDLKVQVLNDNNTEILTTLASMSYDISIMKCQIKALEPVKISFLDDY
jgi:hypothetical protein